MQQLPAEQRATGYGFPVSAQGRRFPAHDMIIGDPIGRADDDGALFVVRHHLPSGIWGLAV